MPGLFISYRREDTPGQAGRLYDRLRAHFGRDRVFMDVAGIKPGVDFVETIQQAVGSCDALIAMIGREWLECVDRTGGRRLDDPNDFVRLEMAAALERGVRVVPVLVEGALLPAAEELPEALRKLARRQAVELRHSRWDDDVDDLIHGLEDVLPPAPTPTPAGTGPDPVKDRNSPDVDPKPAPTRLRWILAGLGLVLALAVAAGLWLSYDKVESVKPTATTLAERASPVEFERTDVEKAIEAEIGRFQEYLQGLGVVAHTEGAVRVHLRPEDKTRSIAWYDADKRLISLHRDYADDLDVVLREYAHDTLSVLTSEASERRGFPPLVAFESGLTFYLPCSFHDRLTFGRPAPAGKTRQYGDVVFGLDHPEGVAALTPRLLEGGQVVMLGGRLWGSIFWDLRMSVGRQVTDASLLAVWKQPRLPATQDELNGAFARAFVEQVMWREGSEAANKVRAVLKRRGFRV